MLACCYDVKYPTTKQTNKHAHAYLWNLQKGLYLHETGHAIGLLHEHQLPDRDRYVTIQYSNVAPSMRGSFIKYDRDAVDTMGVEYDFSSIMHYGKTVSGERGEGGRKRERGGRERERGREGVRERGKRERGEGGSERGGGRGVGRE